MAEPIFFRPLKFLLPNFRPLNYFGENFGPLKVVPDPLNFSGKNFRPLMTISDPLNFSDKIDFSEATLSQIQVLNAFSVQKKY